jgi:hypothetical protein
MTNNLLQKEQDRILSNPALPAAEAIIRLGYKPESGIWSAALRMMRTPDLAGDMIAWVAAGQPGISYPDNTPTALFRPLPGGLTVASLIRDFRLKPVGAFLLASDLETSPDKTLALLRRFAEEGVWVNDEAGRHSLLKLPAGPGSTVSTLVTPEKEPDTVTREDLLALIGRYELRQDMHKAEKKGGSEGGTSRAGSPAEPDPSRRKFCPQCGAPVRPGPKFCGTCGFRFD